jgi:hypothetical protein
MEEAKVNSLDAAESNSVILPQWVNYSAVSKFKSVRRAIKRGHMSIHGIVYPDRPFNNRRNTIGRNQNIQKKKIYEQLKGVQ